MNKIRYNKYMAKWQANKRFGGLRDIVLERDDFSCVECDMNNEQHIVIFGRGITVDHIDGNGRYSKTPNNTLDNLQTLCLRCHGKKDRQRGRSFYELPLASQKKKLKNLKHNKEGG
uniref:Putative homing endonuclease n=1 Tax=viral metagenome TaxID=1070528 RepID=A0A6M3J1Y1_9ZZZZ